MRAKTAKMREYWRERYHQNKEEILGKRKELRFRRGVSFRSHLKRKYGIALEIYDSMVHKQEGRCGLCEKPTPYLWVDHDHKTGKVRALLCPSCNCGLGYFKEHPELLLKAAKYLQCGSPVLEEAPA